MLLKKENLAHIVQAKAISLPHDGEWQLPEKVIQFGTGVLLRGLPGFYINKANRQHLFNGRIVVVKSTDGSTHAFNAQDNLYTHCIKGITEGKMVESYSINAAISRVLSAREDWEKVLACAANPHLQVIISNTTEAGIVLHETDSVQDVPPQSFPGKLLAFLYARYQAFNGSSESAVIIIPTELIVDNGDKLKAIVVQLAHLNKLEQAFISWLTTENIFCNSLVDRIVPGALPPKDKEDLEQTFGYTDEIAIMSEPYSLWAIETSSERAKALLSFSKADASVIITDDIHKYRELKLRLLNGTHTFCCGLAFLGGFTVVNEAVQDAVFNNFISSLMLHETIPCIVDKTIRQEEALAFVHHVINRFSNPFIQHKWLAITLQYTSKIKQRCVPLIVKYYSLYAQPPRRMALGFAAYLFFTKPIRMEGDRFYGEKNGEPYLIQDNEAKLLYELWQEIPAENAVIHLLRNTALWGEDLTTLPHFADMVWMYINELINGANPMALIAEAAQ